jgi:hypothetical protein
MATRAGSLHTAPVKQSAIGWWLAPQLAVVWRAPILLLLSGLGLWYAFRGLVHLAFFAVLHLQLSFLLAPLLLPFAAIPAACFYFLIQRLPRVWRSDSQSLRRLILTTLGWLVAGFLLAQVVDLVQIDLMRLMGIALPRLPLDPY